jgi:hypothetical protein
MEILQGHGYVTLPGGDVEVTFDLHDWPPVDQAYPCTWNAVISDGPVMPVDTEGVLHIDDENTAVGHPFVVILSNGRVSQIRGHVHAA